MEPMRNEGISVKSLTEEEQDDLRESVEILEDLDNEPLWEVEI